jgi:hypothetical protein
VHLQACGSGTIIDLKEGREEGRTGRKERTNTSEGREERRKEGGGNKSEGRKKKTNEGKEDTSRKVMCFCLRTDFTHP